MRPFFFFIWVLLFYRVCSKHVVEIPRMPLHIILHTSNKINNHTIFIRCRAEGRERLLLNIYTLSGIKMILQRTGVWPIIVKYVFGWVQVDPGRNIVFY